MNNFKRLILLCLSIGALSSLLAMESLESAQSATPAAEPLVTFMPFYRALPRAIPQYVYENCNQVTCHTWTQEQFNKLKQAVAGATAEKIRAKLPVVETSDVKEKAIAEKKTEQAFTKQAEAYDWIYGLNLIESYLGNKPYSTMTVADLKNINARLSRIIEHNDGAFRQRDIRWFRKTLSREEGAFLAYVERDPRVFPMLEPTNVHQDIKEGRETILRGAEGGYIDADSIQELLIGLDIIFDENEKIDKDTFEPFNFDPQQVIEWEREQEGTPMYRKGFVHWNTWICKREHNFPASNEIDDQLQRALKVLSQNTHPVVKAAMLWYRIVFIHPWHEANKRTGKAVATWILLSHGYLPPLITRDDAEKYKRLLVDGFQSGDEGVHAFVEFIGELVARTQAKYKGKTL